MADGELLAYDTAQTDGRVPVIGETNHLSPHGRSNSVKTYQLQCNATQRIPFVGFFTRHGEVMQDVPINKKFQ